MAYLTARVLVIRSFVRQAARIACWFYCVAAAEKKTKQKTSRISHLAVPRARSSILQIPLTPRCKLELWTFQPSLAPEGGVARGNLVLSLVSNKKKVIFHCCQVMDVYFYVCQETEQLKKHSPFGKIFNKKKNGEQTPSTGGSLQKHHSRPRSFIPRGLQTKQAHSKPTARGNIWFKNANIEQFHDPQCDTT